MSADPTGTVPSVPTDEGPDRSVPDRPDPEIEIIGAGSVAAAAPTIEFHARIEDLSGQRVYTIALSVLITIEPSKRRYDEADRARLLELFGEPNRWAGTTQSLRWEQVDVLVPSFAGTAEFKIPVACTYDHEVAAAKYFRGVADGEVPLRFHFNGTVFYEGEDGRLQLLQVPWDCNARFQMPVETWKTMIDDHYPGGDWVRLRTSTLDALQRRRAERGHLTVDDTVDELLSEGGE